MGCVVFQKCTCSCKLYEPAKRYSHETTEYLEEFLRNLLLNEKNERHNRNLHISGFLNEEKVDIGDEKVDIELKSSGASKLLSNLVRADIVEPVSGYGKGKYRFKK